MSAITSKLPSSPRAVARPLGLRPQPGEFLFSGRGPLRRFQLEALHQRRSLLEEPCRLQSAA